MNPTGFIDPESGYALDDIPYVKTLLKMALWMPGDKLQTVCPREWEVPVMEQHVGTLDAVHRTYLNRTNIRLDIPFEFRASDPSSPATDLTTATAYYLDPKNCGLYYYEVRLEGKDLPVNSNHFAVGFQAAEGAFEVLYSNDGTVRYPSSGAGEMVPGSSSTVPYSWDDVVGCGFEACDQNGKLRYIFTKNGKLVAQIYEQHGSCMLFPMVRLPTRAMMFTNFGDSPYVSDIDGLFNHYAEKRRKFRRDAATVPDEILHQILTHAVARIAREGAALKRAWQQGHRDADKYKYTGYKVLRRLSMVCRHWRRVCIPLLHETFFLSTRIHVGQFINLFPDPVSALESPGTGTWFLSVSKDAAPHLGLIMVSHVPQQLSAIKTLTWSGRKITTWLVAAPQTRGYTFSHPDSDFPVPPRVAMAIPSFMQAFVELDHLELTNHHFPSFHYFARLVGSLPKLATLTLGGVRCRNSGAIDTPPRWLRPSVHLQRIELDDVDVNLSGLLWLFFSPHRPRLATAEDSTDAVKHRPNLEVPDVFIVFRIVDAWVEHLKPSRLSNFSLSYLPGERSDTWFLKVRTPTSPLDKLTLRVEPSVDYRRKTPGYAVSEVIETVGAWEGAHVLQPFCHKLDRLAGGLSNFPHVACRFVLPLPVPPAAFPEIRWQFRKLMPVVAAANAIHVGKKTVTRVV